MNDICDDCVEAALHDRELIRGVLGMDDGDEDIVYLIATHGVVSEAIEALDGEQSATVDPDFAGWSRDELVSFRGKVATDAHDLLNVLMGTE